MIFVTGDTHGCNDMGKLYNNKIRDGELTKDDYVIILGDFGFIWDSHRTKHEKKWLTWLSKQPWTILFIDGNHDNIPRICSYEEKIWNGGKVHVIFDSVLHLARGQVFEIQGNKFFTMGGASSIDKMWRVENISWWKEEVPNYAEQKEAYDNLNKNNFEVDYVLTHTCPLSTAYDLVYSNIINDIIDDPTMTLLEAIKEKLKFEHWYFGHFHADKELNDKFTVMYNKIIQIK